MDRARNQLVPAPVGPKHTQTPGAQQFHQSAQLALPENRQGQTAGQHKGIEQFAGQRQGHEPLDQPGQ